VATAAAAAATADAAVIAAPYHHHRRHQLLRTAVVQLPMPMPAGHHLYNKRAAGQLSGGGGGSGGNNNIGGHIGAGGDCGGILHGGVKGQRQPFFQRPPSFSRHAYAISLEQLMRWPSRERRTRRPSNSNSVSTRKPSRSP